MPRKIKGRNQGPKAQTGPTGNRAGEMPSEGMTAGDGAASNKIDCILEPVGNAKSWANNIKTVPYTLYRTIALKHANNKSNEPTTRTAGFIGYANMHT